MAIKKLMIANRGEIAVRIIHAARQLGIPTVLACSEADTDSLAARLADEVQLIGPARSANSYLNIEAVLAAANRSGADAIHPGYGFLAENAAFAQATAEAGLVFVGPTAETIACMGDKSLAKRTAQAAGVPVVPGSTGEVSTLSAALNSAETIGYPLLIKASAGGGGRGIRLAHSAEELELEFPVARRDALAGFGYAGVYLERFIRHARHIEVQILGDGERAIHLFERECSLQRRRQKVLEEAPSPAVSATLRQALCESAVALAQSLNYCGAGTIEYLVDADSEEFFFIEMNTRIQVEHPISEMITGVDIVAWMLRIAGGEPLTLSQKEIAIKGVALEMRINAEDPQRNFFPCPGTVGELHWPHGPGIRIESHLYPGYCIPPWYDSLLAKVVIHAADRQQLLSQAVEALRNTTLSGIKTTIPLHLALLESKFMAAGDFHTNSLEQWLQTAILTEVQ